MNVEQELISYVVMSGDYTPLTKDVQAQYFLDDKSKEVYDFIVSFYGEYREVPSPTVLLDRYPDYTLLQDGTAPVSYLVDRLFIEYRTSMLQLGLSAVDDALASDDFDRALAALMSTQSAVLSTSSVEGIVDGSATALERSQAYRNVGRNEGLVGVSTGFSFLDAATQGLQPCQFIVITGLAKSCKTTIALEMLRSVWKNGKRPLMASFEMSSQQILQRFDGFAASINPRRLQTGELTPAEWQRLEHVLLEMHEAHEFFIAEDRSSIMTISGLRSKIEKHSPDVLFVDGAYFMTDEVSRETQTPLALTNISRGLKQLAMTCGVCVVITTQALPHKVGRNNKMNMYSGGYTSAWGQDADVLMGTAADEERPGYYKVPILASRNSMPTENVISISWEPPEIREIEYEDDGLQKF